MKLTNRYGKVNIYKNANRRKWGAYVVAWSVGKRRIRKTFSDELLAQNHAEKVLMQFENGNILAGHITASDALLLETCRTKLGAVPLLEAVEFYIKMHGSSNPAATSETLKVIADDFITDIRRQGNSARDVGTVKSHLTGLCDAIKKPMSLVTTKDLDTYLQEKPCSNRTRHNIRGSILRLWSWAKSKDRIPLKVAGIAEATSAYKVERAKSPGIFTPEDFANILGQADDEWVPYFVIGAFAGLRHAEIQRLTWEDIQLEEKVIILGSDITKTNKRRVAHMPDNLVEWLTHSKVEKVGAVCPGTRPNKATLRAAKLAKIPWVKNGLRHSYISYQMAILRDAGKVAEQCGNSAAEVQASYKANAILSEAEKWFKIRPQIS